MPLHSRCLMEKYHGTPISPRETGMMRMKGRNFCVSFAAPRDAENALTFGQRVMFDSGEFSNFTKGKAPNHPAYMQWLQDKLYHPHWALVPDIIGGSVDDQREVMKSWRYPPLLSCPVWHIHLPLEYLGELVDVWPKVAFGSSGEFWKLGTKEWRERIDLAWAYLRDRSGEHLPNIHMLRAMKLATQGDWPFASADSTNIARNWKNLGKPDIVDMATAIDSQNPPMKSYTAHRVSPQICQLR